MSLFTSTSNISIFEVQVLWKVYNFSTIMPKKDIPVSSFQSFHVSHVLNLVMYCILSGKSELDNDSYDNKLRS